MTFWSKIKKAFNARLIKLAEANKKQFGSSRPDCCSLLNSRKEASNERPDNH
jgi:hypothetical protein